MDETLQASRPRGSDDSQRFLKALRVIAVAALLFCILSIAFNWLSASGSYFEDGIYWIYDCAIYGLAAISFGKGAFVERAAAFMLSLVLAIAGCQGTYDIWSEIVQRAPEAPGTAPYSALIFATGAIVEAALLFRFRKSGEPLMKATWLSARNSATIALAGAAIPVLSHTSSGNDPQIIVDCLDTILAFQAAILVVRETFER